MIWTTEYLNRIVEDAESEIALELECIIDRYSLATEINLSEYQLPDYVQNIRRVFWKGERLDPVPGSEAISWSPAIEDIFEGVFDLTSYEEPAYDVAKINVVPGSGSVGTGGKPRRYFYSKFGENVIKFNPAPNEIISTYGSGLYDTNIANALIIEFYRAPDGAAFKIPEYIRRRTIKSYVLWKAFAKEGDGQNLNASNYWLARHQIGLKRAKLIIGNVYKAITYNRKPNSGNARANMLFNPDGTRRGPLPANYGISLGYGDYD